MSNDDKLRDLWESKFWDAMGCGMNEEQATKVANEATRNLPQQQQKEERRKP
jgi:hypothetical protein